MASRELEIVLSAQDNASSTIKGFGDDIQASLNNVSKYAALAGAAVVGFAATSIVQYSEVGDEVEKMSERTGLSAEAVSALRVAADGAGTSIETIEGALKKMQLNLAEAEDGTTLLDGAIASLGLSTEAFTGLSPEEQFEMLGNSIAAIEDPAARTQAAVEAFGKSGSDLLPLFEDGSFSMAEWSEKAEALGLSFDDLSAQQAAELNDKLGELKGSFQGVFLEVAQALVPKIIELTDKLQPVIENVVNWIEENPKLVTTILTVVAAVTGILAVLAPLGLAISAAGAAFALVVSPVGLVLIAIVALIAGIVLLISYWDEIKAKVEEVWDAIKTKVEDAINAVMSVVVDFVDNIIDTFTSTLDAVGTIFETAFSFIIGAFDLFAQLFWGSLAAFGSFLTTTWQGFMDTITDFFQSMLDALGLIWEGIKLAFSEGFEGLIIIYEEWVEPLLEGWNAIWDALTESLTAFVDGIQSALEPAFDWISGMFEWLQGVVSAIFETVSSIGSAIASAASTAVSTVTGKAHGGPVHAGRSYLVGEKGPELFTPYAGGSITPNNALAGATSVGVNISVGSISSDIDMRTMAQMVGAEIMKTLKTNQRI